MFHSRWVITFTTSRDRRRPSPAAASLRQLLRNVAVQNRKSEELLAMTDRLLARVQDMLDRLAGAERDASGPRRTRPSFRGRPSPRKR